MHGVVFLASASWSFASSPTPRPVPARSSSPSRPRACAGATCTRTGAAGQRAKALASAAGAGPSSAATSLAGWSPPSDRGSGETEAEGRAARHEPPLPGLRAVQALPRGLVPALPQGHRRLRHDRPRRHAPFMKVPARTLVPLPDELSFEEGAAISCRHRHRVRRLEAARRLRARHARGLRPGAGRAQRDAARLRHGRACDRGGPRRRAAPARQGVRRPRRSSTRARRIRWRRCTS